MLNEVPGIHRYEAHLPTVKRRQERSDKRLATGKNNAGCHSAHSFEIQELLNFSEAS